MHRKGYHYTTWANWKTIRKEGLKPYRITRPDLTLFPDNTVQGIWLWKKRMDQRAHVGTIFYQMAKGEDERVVHLEVRYDPEDRLEPPGGGGVISLAHFGTFNKLQYHRGDEAWIITKAIPARQIKLLGRYEYRRAWK